MSDLQTSPRPTRAMTRHFVDVRGRRVHYRRLDAAPGSGAAPVVLMHESPRSSVALLALMAHAPSDGYTVLAFDTPGNGLSDPLPQANPSAADYADAMAATLQALGIGRAAVYGTHTGAACGMALAQRHPDRVAGLVLDGIGAFTPAERAELLGHYLPRFEPWIDGTHMAWLWARVRDQMTFFPWNHRGSGARLGLARPEATLMHAVAMDFLMAGDAYRAPYIAAFEYQPAAVLPLLRTPTWVAAREDDMLRPHLDRLPDLPAHVQVCHLPAHRPAWGAQVWAWLRQAAQGLPDAPAAQDPPLPAHTLGSTLLGPAGQRLHALGALGGGGRPLVLVPPSPGGARGLLRELQAAQGHRPVLVLDLPGHGDSDDFHPGGREDLLDALQAQLQALGLPRDAELRGSGVGGRIAQALAARLGTAERAATPPAPAHTAALPAFDFCPRADGGHLAAAWFHARDAVIFGPWWEPARPPGAPRNFGDALDVPAVHAHAVEVLKEKASAALLREAWWGR